MIAIVTGASSGMGAEFCRVLDSRGYESIWVIARRADRLEELAASMETPCRVVPADLSTVEGLDSLASELRSGQPRIGILINCAGLGRFGTSWEVPRDDTRAMIDLNIAALTEITHLCIPFMERGSGIVEVCSASAYLPLERLNVYSATKAYVRSYCNALRRELRPLGISVIEVSPGWVGTDFIALSKSKTDVPDRVFRHSVAAEDVVRTAMRDLDKGRKRSVCGAYNKLQVFMCTHMPSVASYVWGRSLR